MKNIIALGTLVKFWEQPGRLDAEQPLRVWYSEVKKANWLNPQR
jgi:mRNA interferase HigB